MLRNIILAAMAAFVAVTAALVIAVGGCAASRHRPVHEPADPRQPAAPSPKPVPEKIGSDPGRIGRAASGAEIDAVVYDAVENCGRRGRVSIQPGTWLLPSGTFLPPMPECAEIAEDAK